MFSPSEGLGQKEKNMLDTTKIAAHAASIAAQIVEVSYSLASAEDLISRYELTQADTGWVSALYGIPVENFSTSDWAVLEAAVRAHAESVRHGWYEIGQGLAVRFDGAKPTRISIRDEESPCASYYAAVDGVLAALGFAGRISGWEYGECDEETVAYLVDVSRI